MGTVTSLKEKRDGYLRQVERQQFVRELIGAVKWNFTPILWVGFFTLMMTLGEPDLLTAIIMRVMP